MTASQFGRLFTFVLLDLAVRPRFWAGRLFGIENCFGGVSVSTLTDSNLFELCELWADGRERWQLLHSYLELSSDCSGGVHSVTKPERTTN